MFIIYLCILFISVSFCCCQSSTLVINVVVVKSTDKVTLVCKISSSRAITRWTYLAGPIGTSFMSYQNGQCTVSPSDAFLSNSNTYSYTCNSTAHQVVHNSYHFNNRIIACRDAVQPDGSGDTWMLKVLQDSSCSYCEPKMTFNVQEVNEGNTATFICRVSSDVLYVNWNANLDREYGSHTSFMTVKDGQCAGISFLENTTAYIYTCNMTVYQLTVLNVQRSAHNNMYMCTPFGQTEGTGSNWIIKVRAPAISILMQPTDYPVNVKENTAIEFTCNSSTARPAASVYWYIQSNGNWQNATQITDNITTTTDYNDLSITTSILRFVPTRQDNNTKIFCTANNSLNMSPKSSQMILLNILYKAKYPYILQGGEYRVIENTPGTLSCGVQGGNPTPTLSWSCNNFTPRYQSTINSNGNVTTTLTWNVSRTHEGTCTCTSTQTNFTTETIDVSVVVSYEVSHLSFSINGLTNKIVTVNESTTVIFRCITEGNPSPTMSLINGTSLLVSRTSRLLEYNLSNVSCQDINTYSCSARNELNVHTVVSSIDLIAHCSPRPIKDMDVEILSGIGKTVEITTEVIAYPTPSFMWWSQVNDQWKMIQTSDGRTIDSLGLLSSLTINNVDEDDFTSYKVVAVNSVGNMDHIYILRDGSPDMPTQLQYFETLSTSSSIQLAWDPGYNGGSAQIFYIKYKSTDESSWNYKTVSDDLEQTRIYTLTNLKANMNYYIKVLASNQYGNSTESSLLIANTKESSNLGLLIGGIAGGLIFVVTIVITVCILIRRKKSNKEDMNQPSTCQTESTTGITNEPQTNIQYDDIEKDNGYEMINQDSSPLKLYSVLQENDNMTQAESNRENTYENTI